MGHIDGLFMWQFVYQTFNIFLVSVLLLQNSLLIKFNLFEQFQVNLKA